MDKTDRKLKTNLILCYILTFAVALAAFMAAPSDPHFVINDDVMIRSILDGSYAGENSFMTVYMRVPLSALLALICRMFPSVSVFEFFLQAVCLASFALVAKELISADKTIKKAVFKVVFLISLWFAIYAIYAMQLHYTVVAAVAGAAGLFLFAEGVFEKELRKYPIVTGMLLMILCDEIRKQTFFMVIPFAFIAAAISVIASLKNKDKERLTKLLKICAVPAVLFLLFIAIDKAAYSSNGYAEYMKYNDARTALYDYTGVYDDADAKAYYSSLGLEEPQMKLIREYDIALDADIDAELMEQMAAYNAPSADKDMVTRIRETIWMLRHETLMPADNKEFPILLLITVLAAAALIISSGNFVCFVPLAIVLCIHFGLYGMLFWNGRFPERVVIALYMISTTAVISVGFLAARHPRRERDRLNAGIMVAAAILILAITGPISAGSARDRSEAVGDTNAAYDVLYSYMAKRPDMLYLSDVYADVTSSSVNIPENMLKLGGWITESPLYHKKLEGYGADSMDGLLKGDRELAYVCREGVGLSAEELKAFFDAKYGEDTFLLKPEDEIRSGKEVFHIYLIERTIR